MKTDLIETTKSKNDQSNIQKKGYGKSIDKINRAINNKDIDKAFLYLKKYSNIQEKKSYTHGRIINREAFKKILELQKKIIHLYKELILDKNTHLTLSLFDDYILKKYRNSFTILNSVILAITEHSDPERYNEILRIYKKIHFLISNDIRILTKYNGDRFRDYCLAIISVLKSSLYCGNKKIFINIFNKNKTNLQFIELCEQHIGAEVFDKYHSLQFFSLYLKDFFHLKKYSYVISLIEPYKNIASAWRLIKHYLMSKAAVKHDVNLNYSLIGDDIILLEKTILHRSNEIVDNHMELIYLAIANQEKLTDQELLLKFVQNLNNESQNKISQNNIFQLYLKDQEISDLNDKETIDACTSIIQDTFNVYENCEIIEAQLETGDSKASREIREDEIFENEENSKQLFSDLSEQESHYTLEFKSLNSIDSNTESKESFNGKSTNQVNQCLKLKIQALKKIIYLSIKTMSNIYNGFFSKIRKLFIKEKKTEANKELYDIHSLVNRKRCSDLRRKDSLSQSSSTLSWLSCRNIDVNNQHSFTSNKDRSNRNSKKPIITHSNTF